VAKWIRWQFPSAHAFSATSPYNGVDVKLRLIRAKNMFCLVGDGHYKVE